MTAIPATLATSEDVDAVRMTLDELLAHSLTEEETRDDILLLFDVEVTTEQTKQMSSYLNRLLSLVRSGDLTARQAATDIREIIGSIQSAQYELIFS